MSTHNCPKNIRAYGTQYLDGYMDQFHPNVHCDVCEAKAKKRHEPYVKYLPELRGFMTGDLEPSRDCWDALYDYFYSSMDYGSQTGDTGTIDEWLCDRPEYVEELISEIEFYYPESALETA